MGRLAVEKYRFVFIYKNEPNIAKEFPVKESKKEESASIA